MLITYGMKSSHSILNKLKHQVVNVKLCSIFQLSDVHTIMWPWDADCMISSHTLVYRGIASENIHDKTILQAWKGRGGSRTECQRSLLCLGRRLQIIMGWLPVTHLLQLFCATGSYWTPVDRWMETASMLCQRLLGRSGSIYIVTSLATVFSWLVQKQGQGHRFWNGKISGKL